MASGTNQYGVLKNIEPAGGAVALTKNDSTDLATTPAKALFVGGGGDVAVRMTGEVAAVVFKNVPAGSILPIMIDRLMSTDTSATDVVALYTD